MCFLSGYQSRPKDKCISTNTYIISTPNTCALLPYINMHASIYKYKPLFLVMSSGCVLPASGHFWVCVWDIIGCQ